MPLLLKHVVMERSRVGPLSWTFPAALVLAVGTVWVWLMYAVATRVMVPACELLPRTAWSFAAGAGTALFLLPWSYSGRTPLRISLAFVLAALAGGLAFWATAYLFPRFC